MGVRVLWSDDVRAYQAKCVACGATAQRLTVQEMNKWVVGHWSRHEVERGWESGEEIPSVGVQQAEQALRTRVYSLTQEMMAYPVTPELFGRVRMILQACLVDCVMKDWLPERTLRRVGFLVQASPLDPCTVEVLLLLDEVPDTHALRKLGRGGRWKE